MSSVRPMYRDYEAGRLALALGRGGPSLTVGSAGGVALRRLGFLRYTQPYIGAILAAGDRVPRPPSRAALCNTIPNVLQRVNYLLDRSMIIKGRVELHVSIFLRISMPPMSEGRTNTLEVCLFCHLTALVVYLMA